jgi:glutamine amidotransferase-like uncharacterized protein
MHVICLDIKSTKWPRIFWAINVLLEYGVIVLWNRDNITISNEVLQPGSFLILFEGFLKNDIDSVTLQKYAPLSKKSVITFLNDENLPFLEGELLEPVNVYRLRPSRIALYEESLCYNYALILSISGFDVDWVSGQEVAEGKLEAFNLFISEGGGVAKKPHIRGENVLLTGLGVDGAKLVNKWVSKGGAYLGCCGGSYIASVVAERFMNWWHPAKRYMAMMNIENIHLNEFSHSGFKSPGQGEFTAINLEPMNPVVYGLPEYFSCVHWNGPIYKTIEGAVERASSAIPIAAFYNVAPDKFTPSENYFKPEDSNLESIKNTGIYTACKNRDLSINQGFYGLGLVVLSGSHPERIPEFFGKIDASKLWDSARIISNTAFWAAAKSKITRKDLFEKITSIVVPIQPQTQYLKPILLEIKQKVKNYSSRKIEPSSLWLRPELYNRSFGLTPYEMYDKILSHALILCEEILSKISKIDKLLDNLKNILFEIANNVSLTRKIDEKEALFKLGNKIKRIIFSYYEILGTQKEPFSFQTEPKYLGIYDLIKLAENKCNKAIEREKCFAEPFLNNISYNEIFDNPFSNFKESISNLDNALKIFFVYESNMEKLLALCELYKKTVSI